MSLTNHAEKHRHFHHCPAGLRHDPPAPAGTYSGAGEERWTAGRAGEPFILRLSGTTACHGVPGRPAFPGGGGAEHGGLRLLPDFRLDQSGAPIQPDHRPCPAFRFLLGQRFLASGEQRFLQLSGQQAPFPSGTPGRIPQVHSEGTRFPAKGHQGQSRQLVPVFSAGQHVQRYVPPAGF